MKTLYTIIFIFFSYLSIANVIFVNHAAAGANNGSNWSNAYTNLQLGIDNATNGDSVWVALGTYTPSQYGFVMKEGVKIFGGFNGSETVFSQRNITINTTLLMQAVSCNYLIRNDNNQLTSATVLDGFEITNGNNNPNNNYCIYNRIASPTFSKCVFNMCSSYYGSIYNYVSSSQFINCTFKNNTNINNGIINNNYNAESTLTNCNFLNNVGSCLIANSSSIGFNITNCEFNSNSGGTSVYVWDGQMLMMTQCRFFNNAGSWGGAVYNRSVQSVIRDCIFVNNSASSSGGAVTNEYYSPEFTNCIFVNNSTPYYGGAIRNAFSSPVIRNCTIVGNNAGLNINGYIDGGGCMSNHYSNTTLINSVIWGNSGTGFHNNGSSPSISFSCGQVPGGNNNVNSNPMLLNINNPAGGDGIYGTGDDGMRILSCSPAANTGNNTAVPSSTMYDLVGNPRITLGTVDMGAYESQSNCQLRRYVRRDAPGPFDGTSWATAYNDLQIAISVSEYGDSIWVAAGTYEPPYVPPIPVNESFVMKDGVKIFGGFNGSETQFSQRNFNVNNTILRGVSIFRVIDNSTNYLSTMSELDGFVISNGGGIYTWVDEDGITHINYQIGGNGAGIYNKNSSPVIRNCQFNNNDAYNNFGGAIYNDNSSAQILNCTFQNNKTDYYSGGAIYNKQFSGIIQSCNFSNNLAKIGGAIFTEHSNGIIQLCDFYQNTASYGGGMFSTYNDSTHILNSKFLSNTATYFGGGIDIYGSFNLIKNCFFINNEAPDPSPPARPNEGQGGAIYSYNSYPKLQNCVFSQNFSKKGSAISSSGSNLDVRNCTFAHNSSSELNGTLFFDDSNPNILNSIIWDNNSGIVSSPNSNIIVQYCNVQGGYTGVGNIHLNPLFINEFNPAGADEIYGTYDDGLNVSTCSPAINSGFNSGVGVDNTVDIAYNPRITFTTVDLGAYETQTSAPDNLATMTDTNLSITQTINSGGVNTFTNNCNSLITKVNSLGVNPINGTTTAKVWIENSPPNHFVKRHYEVAPASNINTVTGKVTLYFYQDEFDDYNLLNGIELPKSPTDVNGLSHLVIEKYDGVSSDNSGLPSSYSGNHTIIDPENSDVIWNATLNRWEVSFNTTGFGGYFVSTNSPVTYIFIGDGNWTETSNWYRGIVPPTMLPAGANIVINPIVGGQCVLNTTININISHQIIVAKNKIFRIL